MNRVCRRCDNARALNNSDWCRACWSIWWWSSLLDNKARGTRR